MSISPLGTSHEGPDHAPTPRVGHGLYVGGSDIFNKLNQPAQKLPVYWAEHIEQLDLVGYRPFYDGPPAPAHLRLYRGLTNVVKHRVGIAQEGNIRHISVRRMRLPSLLDTLFQDLWILLNLRPLLARTYATAIVYAPESALIARYLKRSGRVGYLVYHDIDYYPYVPYVRPRQRRIVAWRERLAVRAADAVISVSRPLVKLRQDQGAKNVLYLPNGVDFAYFAQANTQRGDRPPTLLYVGTLDLRWGIDLPIRAMPLILERLPQARMLIAGTGTDEDDLKALAQELGVQDSVQFLGFIPYSDLPALMAQADVGLATSREDLFRQYASPLKLVEYMAAGLPVICSGGGEAELMIAESGGGINVPFTPQACAQAVIDLLANPGDLSARREAAIAYAQTRTWQRLTATLVDFLNAHAAR